MLHVSKVDVSPVRRDLVPIQLGGTRPAVTRKESTQPVDGDSKQGHSVG